MADWLEFNKGTRDFGSQLGDFARKRQELADAIALTVAKANAERQAKEADPYYQLQMKTLSDYLSSKPSSGSPQSVEGSGASSATSLVSPAVEPVITMGTKAPSIKFGGGGSGFGASYIKFSKEMAPAIAEAVKRGDFARFDQADTRTKTVVSNLLPEGFDVTKAKADYTALLQWTKSMNQNQMVGLNTAFNTIEGDVPVLKKLNNELERSDINLVNKLVVGAKLQGIGLDSKGMSDQQIQLASRFITQLNLLRDNMAVAFMRGGVPSEQAFKLTDNILQPSYGGTRVNAALDQIMTNVRIRKSALTRTQPISNTGFFGRNNLTGDILTDRSQPTEKTIIKTGTYKGRQVNQYSDGTIDYAD